MKSKWTKWLLALPLFCAITWVGTQKIGMASDHDDGEMDLKGRSLNLTDLYVFREDQQSGDDEHRDNLVFIMNSNPRSVASQQYYFSTQALYDFHITRVADGRLSPTGADDVILRFTFGKPDAMSKQKITMKIIKDGQTIVKNAAGSGPIYTTPLASSVDPGIGPTNNIVDLDGDNTAKVFAGLREDPFFFDVTRFFRVRAHALNTGEFLTFRPPHEAQDFTKDYNVNSIVVSIPKAYLQSSAGEDFFDTWVTISVPEGALK